MSKTKTLPPYVAAYDNQRETRADGSVWRSRVIDCGSHYAVIWHLVSYPM